MENSMNAVVEKRIAERLQKGMTNAKCAMSKLMEEGKISRDFIFEVGAVRKGIESSIEFKPDPQLKVSATFNLPEEGLREFRVNKHAIQQVAEKLNIPGVYLTSLLYGNQEWQQTLAYQIMNTHNGWTDRSRVLVRSVGDEVRAFLSDQYRRLNSEMIFDSHVQECYNNGGQLSNGFMDDTRISVESLMPKPIEVHTQLNGIVLLAFGTRLTTSDYGDGALELRSFILQGVCLNGMVRESVLRAVHLGAKLPDSLALSKETYALDCKTTASAVKDLTRNLYSTEIIRSRMLEIQTASGIKIEPEKELKNLAGRLLKVETEEIGKILMRNNPEEGVQGESTLWKLTQGITAYANREDVAERRRMELQEIAGGLFNKISE